MPCSLRTGLSYCLIDGRPIFLDIDRDRYFRLEGPREAEFLAKAKAGSHARMCIPQPARSAIELEPAPGSADAATILRIFGLMLRTRRQLRTRAFKRVLRDIVAYRDSRACLTDQARCLEAAGHFLRARLYIPIEPSCLLDSLTLTAYLISRGLSAHIVLGVNDAPFAAHCWVQAGDLVLNDTVGNAMAYMPILVV